MISFLAALAFTYPTFEKSDVVDVYHETTVADPYRKLEEGSSEEVAAWVEAQNRCTENYLSKIPYREAIGRRLTELWDYKRHSVPQQAGSYLFYTKNSGLQNQSPLYVSKEGKERLLFDPNTLSDDGTVALVSFIPSRDGKHVACQLSVSGSDWNEIQLIETATGNRLSETIKWVKFIVPSWDASGFYYARYDEPKQFEEVNTSPKIYYHSLGSDPTTDTLIFADNDHPKRIISPEVTEDGAYLTLYIRDVGMSGWAVYVKDVRKGGEFIHLVDSFEHKNSIVDIIDGNVLMMTNRDAPKFRLVSIPLGEPSRWSEIIPESGDILQEASLSSGHFFTKYLVDATQRVRLFSRDGTYKGEVALPGLGTVTGFYGNRNDTTLYYSFTSFTTPSEIYRYDISSGKSSLLFRPKDFENIYEVKQLFVSSKDGTRVPLFVVHKKGIPLDGTRPALLTGYGGFDISRTPFYSPSIHFFLEQGGVFALANLRGGGEYGEEWHKAGMQGNKQNVFDDFIACAEHMCDAKYTSHEKLAIQGGSNGGLLVGAVINQYPDLCKVAIPQVGVMDMLRYHKFTIGWAWIREYGSSEEAEGFKTLYAYSPLHNIRPGAKYPAVLVTTADHDDRVVPAHSFKYTATLQEVSTSSAPHLIRIETKAGHGGGKPTTKSIEEAKDIWAFIFANVNIREIL